VNPGSAGILPASSPREQAGSLRSQGFLKEDMMGHNETSISMDEIAVNDFLDSRIDNPAPRKYGVKAKTPYAKIKKTYKELDEEYIPYYIEKWKTARESTVYVVYNTIDGNIFITGIDPTHD
jgi:hypothetical protein